MVEFHCSRKAHDGTPIVRDAVLQDYAEAVLQDYKPCLLKEPAKINADHFLESYLGVNLEYQYLYNEEGTPAIAGATVFNDERIQVFDRENKCVRIIDVAADTIIIDNTLVDEGKDTYVHFTALHEGGHFCAHPSVFKRMDGQMDLFAAARSSQPSALRCRRDDIFGGYGRRQLVTEHDHREHQANTLAAAWAMPRPTFVPYAMEQIKSVGYEDGIIVIEDELDLTYDVVLPVLIESIARPFGVSKAAARVQLQRQHLIMDKSTYMQRRHQMVVAF